ncbi:glycogen phosphorylase, putative [Cryptosporidium muris RN66]|uniref:Alpha-1,4 glucan phosphorylase n=1 Tax=Cryptosporidium muris (strain RN66) TaxID=441375 RepID=B6ADG0_CRYMR|nr:glycogen phosphorylase, putative [Cryptosporidium muris RN66]EEA06251.1 glycogen phosphorylase, putative [Cryptosporidium muris RN66]|eukprot:XP_002140600.1 glycogen phosphorylase [Cryptosporidium muris RN66]
MGDSVFVHEGYNFEMRRKASFSKLTGAVPRGMVGMYQDDFDPTADSRREKLWRLMQIYLPTDSESIQKSIVNHVEYTLACTRFNFDDNAAYRATAFSIRDRLIENLNDTNEYFTETDCKRCYYLSLEFLLGRAMQNALVNLDIEDNYKKSLFGLGYSLENLYENEHDAALGNGGLGRLAACFLDSLATKNFPGWGYGIRYTYGIFEQKIVQGRQFEYPDYWLVQSNPWEIERQDVTYGVRFYGKVREFEEYGKKKYRWVDGEVIQAVAYDNPIPGFDTYNCINLRLWKATPSKEFDFSAFNEGKYVDAVCGRQRADYITAVLYPNDNTDQGKELRLKQQYFFVCATMQDILRRFKKTGSVNWKDLPKKVSCQLNDTHPTIAIAEMMRILIDVEDLEWDFAWDITCQCFNYTNHTVLPEALEKWSAALINRLLPRHLMIINEINHRFLNDVRNVMGDGPWISKMSIYEEGWDKKIRMANLAVIGSAKVNGVAVLHTEIVKKDLFSDFVEYYSRKGISDKFVNITNGVTPRRWINCSNPELSHLISSWLGSDSWLTNFDMIQSLQNNIDDEGLQKEWAEVKLHNKQRLARWVEVNTGYKVDTNMLFDIQVKRIHEYKRQLLNVFYIIHRYLMLKKLSTNERKKVVPRCCFFGGKAAPGYAVAKSAIKMINNLSVVINNDPDTKEYLMCIFLPNYNVSNAQVIIPASDISQHISTAGTEASGTSNMKFVMNGGLILGTLDGANVEIKEECGDDTIFIFGALEHQVSEIRAQAANGNYHIDERLQEVFNFIRTGGIMLGDGKAQGEFCDIIDRISSNGNGYVGDHYLLCYDFPLYCKAQEKVDEAYKNKKEWVKTCIKATSSMGKFSTDRTIEEYATLIWGLEPCERPAPESCHRLSICSQSSDRTATKK